MFLSSFFFLLSSNSFNFASLLCIIVSTRINSAGALLATRLLIQGMKAFNVETYQNVI